MNNLKDEEIALLMTKISKALLTRELTGWEKDFLENAFKQLQKGRTLTEKQQTVLTKLLKSR